MGEAGYLPPSSAGSRVAAISLILGVHAAAVAVFASMGGAQVVVERAPLLAAFLHETPPVAVPAVLERTRPSPRLRQPEIPIPEMPHFDVIAAENHERPAPLPSARALTSAAAATETAEPIESPPFDLAYLNNPPPIYPPFARRAREQGLVQLRVRVDANGSVKGIEVYKSSGFERLDRAAIAAVWRWRFAPARRGGDAVAAWALVPVRFQLDA